MLSPLKLGIETKKINIWYVHSSLSYEICIADAHMDSIFQWIEEILHYYSLLHYVTKYDPKYFLTPSPQANYAGFIQALEFQETWH